MDSILTILILLVARHSERRTGASHPPAPTAGADRLGGLIALSIVETVELRPEIFFLLFLPPCCSLDGWRIPKASLLRDRAIILELALGLVILTVVGVGFLIHWWIPAMPLPVAFALAAVVSPTDPIAVSAIASRTPIPSEWSTS